MLCFSPLAPYQACFGRFGGLEMGSREHWKGPSCGMEEFLEEPMNDLEERSEWRVTVTAQGLPCMAWLQEYPGRGQPRDGNQRQAERSLTSTSGGPVVRPSQQREFARFPGAVVLLKVLKGHTITDISGGRSRDRSLCPKIRWEKLLLNQGSTGDSRVREITGAYLAGRTTRGSFQTHLGTWQSQGTDWGHRIPMLTLSWLSIYLKDSNFKMGETIEECFSTHLHPFCQPSFNFCC